MEPDTLRLDIKTEGEFARRIRAAAARNGDVAPASWARYALARQLQYEEQAEEKRQAASDAGKKGRKKRKLGHGFTDEELEEWADS